MKPAPALLVALLATSCVSPEKDGPWTPPPKEVVDTELDSVIAGRLWVVPNPIRFRPEWGGEFGIAPGLAIAVENIGSERVTVLDTHIIGSSEFFFGWELHPTGGTPNRPVMHEGQPECAGGAGMGFSIHYVPSGEILQEGALVIETDDPTSPTFQVPIVLDTTGTLTPDDPDDYIAYNGDAYIWVKPNPIRIPADATSTTDLCVEIPNYSEGCSLDLIRVHGEGLALVDPTDYDHPRISYVPTVLGPVDGAFIVDFTDNWGDSHTLVVPILVR